MTGYDLGPDDLIAAYYTLAHVDRHGTARTPFPERVAAASAAGFRGIGIQPHDHARSRDAGFSDAEMHELLDHHGVVLGEVDGVPWWPDAAAKPAPTRQSDPWNPRSWQKRRKIPALNGLN